MEKFSLFVFGIYILILISIDSSNSQETCSPPDFPEKGYYLPHLNEFQPGSTVTYSCEKSYNLVGNDMNKCKWDGNWSHATPFCDRKAELKMSYAWFLDGQKQPIPQLKDSNLTTCFPLRKRERIEVNLEKKKVVYAVRLYLGFGLTKVEILLGIKKCGHILNKYLETSDWVMIKCNNNTELSDSVMIQDKSDKSNSSDICEIEVYVKEEYECQNPPPQRKILNGHFEVSRTRARLVCAEGYKSVSNNLICEDNQWKGQNQILHCEEMLCDPQLNFTKPTGGDWIFLDPVKKISAGTKRQLNCHADYRKTGHPDIIECQKNGIWTETNATCVGLNETLNEEYDTPSAKNSNKRKLEDSPTTRMSDLIEKEGKKAEAINKLAEAIERSNEIAQERNKILRERNEIERDRNNVFETASTNLLHMLQQFLSNS